MNLEDFIKNNRQEFEEKEVPSKMWEKISVEIQPKVKSRSLSNSTILRIAASAIFLITIGYFAGKYGKSTAENSDLVALNPSYAKDVVLYSSFVSDKRKELEKIKQSRPDLLKQFENDWTELDQSYKKLKADLPNNPNQEELVKAMIQNLQWQIQVLNQQLEILEKVKNKENEEVKDMV